MLPKIRSIIFLLWNGYDYKCKKLTIKRIKKFHLEFGNIKKKKKEGEANSNSCHFFFNEIIVVRMVTCKEGRYLA